MKKVLIITYYWPPAGGVSAQRWLKFAKYLPENSWQPIVFTANEGDYPLLDYELAKQIPDCAEEHRIAFFDPRTLVKKVLKKEKAENGNKKDNLDRIFFIPKEERTWKQNLMLWVRANFFIPDARMFWIRPTTKAILKYLKENPVDAIVSTGPPHSAHLIARQIKKATGIHWIADFRDPWTFIEFFELLPLSKRAKRKHFDLEKAVVQEADCVTIVSESWKQEYEKLNPKRIEVLHNGYDLDDFKGLKSNKNPQKLVISHIGTFQEDRNPVTLWKALKELTTEDKVIREALEIQLIGNVDTRIVDYLESIGLGDSVNHIGMVSHQKALEYMSSANILLLIINQSKVNSKGRLTAKLYEYMATRNPILMIGPTDSDAAAVVQKLGNSRVIEEASITTMKEQLIRFFQTIKEDSTVANAAIDVYDRRNLTKELVGLLGWFTG